MEYSGNYVTYFYQGDDTMYQFSQDLVTQELKQQLISALQQQAMTDTNVNEFMQTYSRNGKCQYNDVGYVFLLWQFPEAGKSGNPKIHVRTWQPEKLEGKLLSDDEKIKLSDFEGLQ